MALVTYSFKATFGVFQQRTLFRRILFSCKNLLLYIVWNRPPFVIRPWPLKSNYSTETSSSSSTESVSKSLLQNLIGLFYFGNAEAASQSQQLRELSSTLSESLRSLQQLATLASSSTSEVLRTHCGAVFALLTETARAAAVAVRDNKHSLPPNRLHSAQVLGIHVVLSNALRLGCHSPDCWLHLLNACQLVRELEHAYFAAVCDSKSLVAKVYVTVPPYYL